MTVRELFEKVEFDALVPTLDKLTRHQTPLSQRAYFKMAYDELMLMTPEEDVEPFELRRGEDGELYPNAGIELEGDIWEESLGREIIIPEGPEIPLEKLAAYLLWSLTFYGFSAASRPFLRTASVDEFSKRRFEIRQKQTAAYGRISLKKLNAMSVLDDEYMEAEMRAEKNARRRNRAKRMRDHRRDVQIARLERKSKVHETIFELTCKADDFSEEDFAYLYDTKLISDNCYHSQTADDSTRIDYLIDLIRNYGCVDYSEFDSMVFVVSVDKERELSEEEMRRLQEFVEPFNPQKRSEFHYCTAAGFGPGAEIMIVASRDE